MPLPATWKTVTVTATFTRADTAGPAAGSVQFTPVKAVGIAADVVLPALITATLNGSGQISVALPCPDDAESGFTSLVYEVIERVPGGRSYYIELANTMSAEQLADIPQVLASDEQQVWAASARSSAQAASDAALAAAAAESSASASAATASTQAEAAASSEAASAASATAAGNSAEAAAISADAAGLAAATAESVAGPTYANVAAGEAATTTGQAFAVDSGGGTVSIYQRTVGGSTLQRTLATTGALAASTGASLVGFQQSGSGAVARTMQDKGREQYVTPLDFGGVGDGVTDDTAAILAMCASGAKRFDFLDKSWKVTMPNNAALVTFNAINGIKIRGAGAEIYDPRVYTGDPIAPVLDFVGCSDVAVTGLNYRGAVLASPATNLGYLGGTFIRFRNGSSNLTVDAEIRNARYGVLSGHYSDETQGACKNFNLRLKTSLCGYPLAVYYADAVKADIYAEDIHRAAYLAGVDGGDIRAQWRNQYIADIVVLLTDAKTGTGAQRGCRDLRIASYDLGSTVFQASSACCGLGNSRVGPITIHENLSFDFRVKSNDTVSTRVGGFKVASGALPGGEPFFWEPEVILRNFKVSGIIDRTGQTLDSNSAGDIYWSSNDSGVHVATVSNISFDGVTIIPSSGTTRNCYFVASGLTDQVTFNRFTSSGAVGLIIGTNSTAKAHFENAAIPSMSSNGTVGPIYMRGASLGSVPDNLTSNGVIGGSIETNGGGLKLRMKQVTLALSGASVNWAAGIPINAMVVGLTSRIQADITGATGYQIGISGDLSRYANVNNLTAGQTTGASNYAATELTPRVYQGSTTVVVTAKTSNFTGGSLKLNLFYFELSPPNS